MLHERQMGKICMLDSTRMKGGWGTHAHDSCSRTQGGKQPYHICRVPHRYPCYLRNVRYAQEVKILTHRLLLSLFLLLWGRLDRHFRCGHGPLRLRRTGGRCCLRPVRRALSSLFALFACFDSSFSATVRHPQVVMYALCVPYV